MLGEDDLLMASAKETADAIRTARLRVCSALHLLTHRIEWSARLRQERCDSGENWKHPADVDAERDIKLAQLCDDIAEALEGAWQSAEEFLTEVEGING